MATALELFRAGHDTIEIKNILRITESEALAQVSSQRAASLGIPDPYKSHSPRVASWPSGRVAYAGRV